MDIFRRLTILLSIMFLFLAVSSPTLVVAGVNSQLPHEVISKVFWTATLTTEGKTLQTIEIVYHNQGDGKVNFNSSVRIDVRNTDSVILTMPNNTEMSLKLYYDPVEDTLFVRTPSLNFDMNKNDIETFKLSFENKVSLTIDKNGTHIFHTKSGSYNLSDDFQYKLKIQKKTTFIDVITFSYIKKLSSTPENPAIYDEQDHVVMIWDKFSGKPNVQIIFTYRYDNDWTQVIVFLMSIGVIGWILSKALKFLKKRSKTLNDNRDITLS